VPLEISENRYVIKKDIEGDAKIMRTFNSILNKLTPEKFDKLAKQAVELDIARVSLLRQVVGAMFEKAISEPAFSPTYAEFCLYLSKNMSQDILMDETPVDDKPVTFRRLILNRCQEEFENFTKDEAANAELTPEQKTEKSVAARRRMLGVIRLIGEMFVRSIVVSNVIQHCINTLLGLSSDEESIEALCKLLATIGKTLTRPKVMQSPAHQEFVNNTFNTLKALAVDKDKVPSSRHRFMIKDLLDLKDRQWVERIKKEIEAKKLSEVHKEAAHTAPSTKKETPVMPAPAPRMPRKDRYALPESSLPTKDADGWTTTGGSSAQRSGKGFGKDRTPRNLGSARGGQGKFGFGPSSASSYKGGNQDVRGAPVRNQPSKSNKEQKDQMSVSKGGFAALLDDESDAEKEEEEAEAEEEVEEEEAEAEAEGDEAASGDSDEPTDEMADATEDQKKKIAVVISDFFTTSGDMKEGVNETVKTALKEATVGLKEAGSASIRHVLAAQGLAKVIEGKEKEAKKYAALMTYMYEEKLLSAKQILTPLDNEVELFEDIAIDSPMLPHNIGIVLAALLLCGVVTPDYFASEKFETLKEGGSGIVSNVVVQTLLAIRQQKDEDYVKNLFTSNALAGSFVSMMSGRQQNKEAAQKFLTNKGLEFLADSI